jgi:hypothetical protein
VLFRQKINFFNDLKFFQNRLQNISTPSQFHPKKEKVVTKLVEKCQDRVLCADLFLPLCNRKRNKIKNIYSL